MKPYSGLTTAQARREILAMQPFVVEMGELALDAYPTISNVSVTAGNNYFDIPGQGQPRIALNTYVSVEGSGDREIAAITTFSTYTRYTFAFGTIQVSGNKTIIFNDQLWLGAPGSHYDLGLILVSGGYDLNSSRPVIVQLGYLAELGATDYEFRIRLPLVPVGTSITFRLRHDRLPIPGTATVIFETIPPETVSAVQIADSIMFTKNPTGAIHTLVSNGDDTWEVTESTENAIEPGITLSDAVNTQGSSIASAATTDLSTATGVFVNISGTTTITSFGSAPAGALRVLCFDSTLVLTHHVFSLILPGSQSIITTSGDIIKMRSLGSESWKCEEFLPFRRGTRRRMLSTIESNWATTSSGTVAANTVSNGGRLLQVAASTAGRAYASYNIAGGASILPGTPTQHDFDKSFRLRWNYTLNVGANPTSSCRCCLHTSATSGTGNDLTSKGLSVQWLGNGTSPTVRLQAYQSSATNSAATVIAAADDTIHDAELVYVAGAGAYLFIDGVLMCSLTTGLPTGLGSVNLVRTAVAVENVAGDASGITLRLLGFMETEIAS